MFYKLDKTKIEELLNFINENKKCFSSTVDRLTRKFEYVSPEAPVFITGGLYSTKESEFRKITADAFRKAGFKNVVTFDDIIELAEPYEDGWLYCQKLMCKICTYTNGLVIELDHWYFELEEAKDDEQK